MDRYDFPNCSLLRTHQRAMPHARIRGDFDAIERTTARFLAVEAERPLSPGQADLPRHAREREEAPKPDLDPEPTALPLMTRCGRERALRRLKPSFLSLDISPLRAECCSPRIIPPTRSRASARCGMHSWHMNVPHRANIAARQCSSSTRDQPHMNTVEYPIRVTRLRRLNDA